VVNTSLKELPNNSPGTRSVRNPAPKNPAIPGKRPTTMHPKTPLITPNPPQPRQHIRAPKSRPPSSVLRPPSSVLRRPWSLPSTFNPNSALCTHNSSFAPRPMPLSVTISKSRFVTVVNGIFLKSPVRRTFNQTEETPVKAMRKSPIRRPQPFAFRLRPFWKGPIVRRPIRVMNCHLVSGRCHLLSGQCHELSVAKRRFCLLFYLRFWVLGFGVDRWLLQRPPIPDPNPVL